MARSQHSTAPQQPRSKSPKCSHTPIVGLLLEPQSSACGMVTVMLQGSNLSYQTLTTKATCPQCSADPCRRSGEKDTGLRHQATPSMTHRKQPQPGPFEQYPKISPGARGAAGGMAAGEGESTGGAQAKRPTFICVLGPHPGPLRWILWDADEAQVACPRNQRPPGVLRSSPYTALV